VIERRVDINRFGTDTARNRMTIFNALNTFDMMGTDKESRRLSNITSLNWKSRVRTLYTFGRREFSIHFVCKNAQISRNPHFQWYACAAIWFEQAFFLQPQGR
jgi:hypothetical protein